MRQYALMLPVVLAAGLSADDGRMVVSSDSAEVHSAMSGSSPVVKTLHVGDVVTVELSLSAEDGPWCNVQIAGQPNLGWLRCDALSTTTPPSTDKWQRVEDAQPQAASAEESAETPYLAKARKLCPAFDYSQIKQGWPLRQVAPSLELGRCLEGAPGPRLTSSQIRQWQAEAERTGAQACWQRYLAIREKHRADEREQQGWALAAEREWKRDGCYGRVSGFQFRMMFGPFYGKLPQMYDDVMSGRQPNLH